MKKSYLFFLGMSAVLLTFGLALTGCGDDGGSPDPTPVTFSNLTADGTAGTAATTALTLTFSEAITGLTEEDITLSGVSGVTKGTLTNSGPVYTLPISGHSADGTLTVAVAKGGYAISPASKTVTIVYHPPTPVTFSNLTANGTAGTAATTALTLTFNAAITGLTKEDITLSGVPGVIKGTLTNSGAVYTLPISGFTSGGTLTVAVAKGGYTITTASKTVTIVYVPPTPVTFSSVTANGEAETTVTTVLTLTFSAAITNLAAADITVTGPSGVTFTKGDLANTSGGTYTLGITELSAAGTLTVAVAKAGYTITTASKTVDVYHSDIAVTFTSAVSDTTSASETDTTALILTFNKAITDLAATDFTVTDSSGNSVTLGDLTSTSAPEYSLALDASPDDNDTFTVAVAKTGYIITPSSISNVAVYGGNDE